MVWYHLKIYCDTLNICSPDFKAVIKILQQASTNPLETNDKIENLNKEIKVTLKNSVTKIKTEIIF